jgi:hypothetical protein
MGDRMSSAVPGPIVARHSTRYPIRALRKQIPGEPPDGVYVVVRGKGATVRRFDAAPQAEVTDAWFPKPLATRR